MAAIVWQNSFDTGIQEIDNQHRQLLDYLNQLDEARVENDPHTVKEVIDGLTDYTLSHFAFEETLMSEAGYAFAGPHRHVHQTLIQRVTVFHERFAAGENITDELYGLLRRWLVNHIQRDDAAYVRVVKPHLQAMTVAADGGGEAAATAESKGWVSRMVRKFFG